MIVQGVTIKNSRIVDGTVITQNLLVYLDANNATSYPGSGTSVYDLSGNNYTHTLTNAPYTVLSGIKCFDCTTSGIITVNGTGPTLPTTGFTYIAWARMNSSSATYRTLWRTQPDDHPLLIAIHTDILGMWDNNGVGFITTGYSVASLSNQWVQWVVSGTNSAQTFYINGQQVGTTNLGTGGNRHAEIGSTGGSQPYGYIANALLYNRILTLEQIQQNYYGLKGRFGL